MSFEELIRSTVLSACREVLRAELPDLLKHREPGDAGEFISPTEAARVASVHVDTIRLWMKQGKLPGHKVAGGRRLRVRRDELTRFLSSEPVIAESDDDTSAEEIAAAALGKRRDG